MSQKKKVVLAVLASLLFHLLLIVFFSWWRAAHPEPPELVIKPKPPELTLIPMDEPQLAMAPTPPPVAQVIRSQNMIEANEPPPNTEFESDRDTLGASEKSGTGPRDRPSVDGRESQELEVVTRDLVLGQMSADNGKTATQETAATPAPKPSTVQKPVAETTPAPPSTPPPALDDNTLAIARQQATPPPPPETQPARSGVGTFQPQTRASRMEGSLSNRGRPSIAARGTPIGRYLRQVEAAIGSRWYYYIQRDRAFISAGAVRIIFCINQDGKIEDLRRLSNTANESFASTSEQSIFDAELPPIPSDIVPTLPTGRMELPFTFTYQDYQE